MAFKLLQIRETEMLMNLFRKGFRIEKKCGYDSEGFIIALTVGYIDALILAKDTEFNNFIFFEKFINELPEAGSYLVGVLDKIYYKTLTIDEFTQYCKVAENRQGIHEFGKQLLSVQDDFDLKNLSLILRDFSKKFNVQVLVHYFNREPEEIMMNRYTDALIINLYSYEENDQGNHEVFSSIYNANFRVIDEANNNCSRKVTVESFKTNDDFVSALVIKKLLKELKENYISAKMIENVSNAYQKLCNDSGDRWGFHADVQELLAENTPCENDCFKLRVFGKLKCGCSLCKECWDKSSHRSACEKCKRSLS